MKRQRNLVPRNQRSFLGVLTTLTTLIALGTLTGAGAQTPKVVNLTYWNWGVEGTQGQIDRFNASHPGIKVTWNKVPSSGFYDKLSTALKADNAPDVANIELQFLPTVISTGGLIDLNKYGVAAYKARFEPWVWNQVALGGSTYAIPTDLGPMGMLYRADLFKKYGVAVPKTWAEYASAASKLHAADPKLFITTFAPNDAGWFSGMAWQSGAKWFEISGDSWKVTINDSATKRVAQYWQDLIDKKLVKPGPIWADGWYNDLQTGEVATWLTASWGTGFLESFAPKTSGNWRVAPLPSWEAGKPAASNWGGSTTAVTKSSKFPKEAATFALWLGTDLKGSVKPLVKTGAWFPAVRGAMDNADLSLTSKFYGNQAVNRVFKNASRVVDTRFQWGPTMSQVYRDLQDGFGAAVNGKGNLSSVLDTVQESTLAAMRKQGFDIK